MNLETTYNFKLGGRITYTNNINFKEEGGGGAMILKQMEVYTVKWSFTLNHFPFKQKGKALQNKTPSYIRI